MPERIRLLGAPLDTVTLDDAVKLIASAIDGQSAAAE